MISFDQYSTDDSYGVESAWEPDRGGWIKIPRAFLYHQHPLHPRRRGEKACHSFAWFDTIGSARWERSDDLKRGQLVAAQSYFANRWGWGINKVAGFLTELEKVGLIKRQRGTGRRPTVITISNFDYYSTPPDTVRGVRAWSR